MGEIFLARQAIAGVHRLVVLKRLLPELAEDPQQLAMFVDEARIAANLAHPNIVHVHEFGQDEQGHFIVMEYVPGMHVGRLLTRALRDQQPLEPRIGAFIVHEVARGLDHAHRARDAAGTPLEIVHRDISPQNVLVSFAGDVKLMDFGIARAANRTRKTNDGSIRGKFPYMSPEQVESKPIDARSDIFAMGVVLWEITLNRRLFTGETDYEIIRAVLDAPIPTPRSIDPSYSPVLEALVMKTLERDPDRRLANAGELATGLKAYLKDHPADRDDLAATMAALFPEDAADVAQLEKEHTEHVVPTVPTVVVSPAPAKPPNRRWPIVIGMLALAGVAGLGVRAWLAPHDVPVVPRDAVAVAVVEARDADSVVVVVDAAVPDATIDASPHKLTPSGRSVPDAGVRDAATITQAVEVIDAGTATGQLRFVFEENEDNGTNVEILVDGVRPTRGTCTAPTIQSRCTLSIGSHHFAFKVSSTGATFDQNVEVGPNVAKCKVALSRKEVSCAPL
jgi:Protein kinase domain